MSQAILAIIFNHKYDGNIPRLFEMYCNRFSEIVFIVPFFDNPDLSLRYCVIPVYETSYSFQGYIAQAMTHLEVNDKKHIIFIGDDLILNPEVNENNYMEFFRLDEETSFNTEICKINERFERYLWSYERIFENLNNLDGNRFVTTTNEIPSREEAYEIVTKKGYVDFEFVGSPYFQAVGLMTKLKVLLRNLIKRKYYPAFGGYSDLTVISTRDIGLFSHYCGVFAAMGVFVEIAIPTAIVLSCKKFTTAKELEYTRGDIWGMKVKEEFAKEYHHSINELLEKWPEKKLYIHPIKLSKWKEKKGE